MVRKLVIVGLGNPGAGYARTRHNLGAMLIDRLASQLRVDLKRKRGRIRAAEAVLEGSPVALGIPTTYVNDSGGPVAALVRKAGAKPAQLLVCHDELDIPLGRIRLKVGGGTAGHRGLDSICASLRSPDFLRLRLGIGRPDIGSDATDKVLTTFRPDEKELVAAALDKATEGIRVLLRSGVDAAQLYLHSPGDPTPDPK
jgi:PTH1 family peptidyl-tRNA hydrolase